MMSGLAVLFVLLRLVRYNIIEKAQQPQSMLSRLFVLCVLLHLAY